MDTASDTTMNPIVVPASPPPAAVSSSHAEEVPETPPLSSGGSSGGSSSSSSTSSSANPSADPSADCAADSAADSTSDSFSFLSGDGDDDDDDMSSVVESEGKEWDTPSTNVTLFGSEAYGLDAYITDTNFRLGGWRAGTPIELARHDVSTWRCREFNTPGHTWSFDVRTGELNDAVTGKAAMITEHGEIKQIRKSSYY